MHMTFYWCRNVTLLFSSWQTDSWISYTLTLLTCFIFSILYQYMEDHCLRFKLLSTSAASTTTNGTTVDATPLLSKKIFAVGVVVGG
ncbi:putative Ctr copper transporter [Helianthus debilis subsp. tardiflorus]